MKKLILLLCGAFWSGLAVFGQAAYTYDLRTGYAEAAGLGPALTVIDSGAIGTDTLTCTGEVRPVHRFPFNTGLAFNNRLAPSRIGQSYTIEAVFKFQTMSTYRRVLDFRNRRSDQGVYLRTSGASFYDVSTNRSAGPFAPRQWVHLALTRDSATRRVNLYVAGTLNAFFTDTPGDALPDTAQLIRFFQDDVAGVRNEAAAGSVAFIRLTRQALDSATIAGRFQELRCLMAADDYLLTEPALTLTPNPAATGAALHLATAPAGFAYRVHGADGRLHTQGRSAGPRHELDLSTLPPGLYVVTAVAAGRSYQVRLVRA